MAGYDYNSVNNALQNLGATFDDIGDRDRKRAAQLLQDKLINQQIEENGLKLADARQMNDTRSAARDAYRNAQDTTTTSVIPAKPTAARAELMDFPGLKAAYAAQPAAASGSLDAEMQANGLTDTAPDASGFNMPAETPSPLVQAYAENRVKSTTVPADRMGAMAQAYLAGGRPEEAAKINTMQTQQINLDDMLLKRKATAEANGDLQTAYKLDAESSRLKVMGSMLEELKKADPSGGLIRQVVTNKPELFPGVDPAKIGVANGLITLPFSQNGVSGVLLQTPDGKWMFEKSAASSTAHNVQEVPSADGRTARKFQYNPTTQRYDIPLGQSYLVKSQVPSVNLRVNAPTSDNVETMAQMLARGEMDASQLPKRQGLFNEVVARAKQLNPQLNIRDASANFSLAKNPTFRQRAITAESLPEVMNSMVELGKKLDFPEAKFVGKVKAWGMGQINDPTFTEYMALRNDALMEIAQVMRGSGMTDMAHRAETEVSNPTMSPRALDAWLRAQNRALQPRLKRFNTVIGGQGAAPGAVQSGRFSVQVVQ